MPDHGLLIPGIGADDPDDVAVVRALVAVEVAWARVLEATEAASDGAGDAIDAAGRRLVADDGDASRFATELALRAADSGNAVVPLVEALRREAGAEHAGVVHAGLTSQDVLDTALVLVVRDAAGVVHRALAAAGADLTRLATDHRATPVLAHTLGQAALPTTLGARAAGWLQALAEADRRLEREAAELPVAFGGAAGTLATPGAPDPTSFEAAEEWARGLGLRTTPAPWHVTRFPIERITGALAEVCAALGTIASDVLVSARPESGELREHSRPGKGTSSSMPFKSNPVLSIHMRRSAIAAPHLLAQVHSAAGFAVDERPDGAWHAEWDALRDLARHAVIASRCAAELLRDLEVDVEAASRNLAAHGNGATDVGRAEEVVARVVESYGYEAS